MHCAQRLIVFAALTVLSSSGFANTILTFDIPGASGFDFIPQDYGDNVTTSPDGNGFLYGGTKDTPNITVEYRAVETDGATTDLPDLSFWDFFYGDLLNVAFANQVTGSGYAEIRLLPAVGHAVTLNSFDLGGWPAADRPVETVRVLNDSFGVLRDFTPWTARGNGHDTFNIGITSSTPIRIQWGLNAVFVGIDNVNFSQNNGTVQPIPEPTTWTLFAAGLLGLALLRKKRPAT